jgi:HAD superfamily hydrolase (TIGR01509 family)
MQILETTPNINNLEDINPECKAILWDMDGTIMETEVLHINSTKALINEMSPNNKLSDEEIEVICTGNTDQVIFQLLEKKDIITKTLEEFIDQKNLILGKMLKLVDKNTIFNPEISKFMKAAQDKGIAQAVVTSSEKEVTHDLLDFLELKPYFNFIITREDTDENKPSPMPYNKAISMLSLEDKDVVIFEDSVVGLKAANSTNASVCHAKWYNL